MITKDLHEAFDILTRLWLIQLNRQYSNFYSYGNLAPAGATLSYLLYNSFSEDEIIAMTNNRELENDFQPRIWDFYSIFIETSTTYFEELLKKDPESFETLGFYFGGNGKQLATFSFLFGEFVSLCFRHLNTALEVDYENQIKRVTFDNMNAAVEEACQNAVNTFAPFMSEVYSLTEQVVLDLGSDEDTDTPITGTPADNLTLFQLHTYLLTAFREGEGITPLFNSDYTAITSILDRIDGVISESGVSARPHYEVDNRKGLVASYKTSN